MCWTAYFKRPVKSREKEAPLVAVVWKVNFDFAPSFYIMRKLGFDSNHSKLIKAGIEKVTDAVSGRG